MNNKKRRFESKSSEDLTQLLNSKKLKELEGLVVTKNFEKFFEKNKKKVNVAPNLKAARSRSSSAERHEEGNTEDIPDTNETDKFKTPRKYIRKRTVSSQPPDGEAAGTSNSFDPLANEMICDDPVTTAQENQNQGNNIKSNDRPKQSQPQKQNSSNLNRNASGAFKPKARPPPIHVYTINMKALIKIITDGKIPEGEFWVRHTDKDYITVNTLKSEIHKKIKEILQNNSAQFYSYTLKEDKKISLVLKGIKPEYDEVDVTNSINNKNLPNVKIERVTKLQYDSKVKEKFFFIVQLTNGSKPAELTKIKYLLHQNIRWERLKKKTVFQCRRCQRVGHSSINCNLEYRCVKCGQNHGPIKEGGVCTVTATTDKSLLKCINCGENGHTASYKGCPYLSMAQDVKKQTLDLRKSIKTNKINKITRTVNPNLTFANIMSNNSSFPPLPSRHTVNESSDEVPRPPPSNNPAQHIGNNLNSIEETLTHFKNSILNILKDQFTEINKKITDNSRKIEFLLSAFDNE